MIHDFPALSVTFSERALRIFMEFLMVRRYAMAVAIGSITAMANRGIQH